MLPTGRYCRYIIEASAQEEKAAVRSTVVMARGFNSWMPSFLSVCSPQQVPVKLPPSLPFEGESSYRTEYGPKPLPPRVKPAEVKLPPSLPFEETTAYRSDYGPKPLPPPVKPAEVKLQPSLPFEANSSYR